MVSQQCKQSQWTVPWVDSIEQQDQLRECQVLEPQRQSRSDICSDRRGNPNTRRCNMTVTFHLKHTNTHTHGLMGLCLGLPG